MFTYQSQTTWTNCQWKISHSETNGEKENILTQTLTIQFNKLSRPILNSKRAGKRKLFSLRQKCNVRESKDYWDNMSKKSSTLKDDWDNMSEKSSTLREREHIRESSHIQSQSTRRKSQRKPLHLNVTGKKWQSVSESFLKDDWDKCSL